MNLQEKINNYLDKKSKFFPYQSVSVDMGESVFDGIIKENSFDKHSYLVEIDTPVGLKTIEARENQIYAAEEVSPEDEAQIRSVFAKETEIHGKLKEIDELVNKFRVTLLDYFDIPGLLEDKKTLDKIAIDALKRSSKWATAINNFYVYLKRVGPGAKSTKYAAVVKEYGSYLNSLSKTIGDKYPQFKDILTEAIMYYNDILKQYSRPEVPGRELALEVRHEEELPPEVKDLIKGVVPKEIKPQSTPPIVSEEEELEKMVKGDVESALGDLWANFMKWVTSVFTKNLDKADGIIDKISDAFKK